MLTFGGNAAAVLSGQGSILTSVSTPTIQVSHSQPEPTSSGNPEPLSTCLSSPFIPSSTSQIQAFAKTGVHINVLPGTKSAPGPNIVDVAWAEAMKIAKEKLGDTFPLELMNLTPQPAGDNIRAIIGALNTLQTDEKKKQWSYTWRGKKVIIAERLGRILKIVEPYSKVVDTAIQVNPQVAALVWAGVWAIMRVGINLLCQLGETMLILLW